MELSNISVNKDGVLVRNSLKREFTSDGNLIELTPDDFNEEYYINERNVMVVNWQYEVITVGRYGLMHGKQVAEMKGLVSMRVGRCIRVFEK